MDFDTFSSLPLDFTFQFVTYLDETITGIPFVDNSNDLRKCYVIPATKAREFINSKLLISEKIQLGILIPINLDVVDDYKKINDR